MQCLMCGREITNPNANYCDYCGTAVGSMEYRQERPVSQPSQAQKTEPVSTWLFLGIMCLPFVPFVGTIAYLVFLFYWAFAPSIEDSRKSFARATLIYTAISLVIALVLFGALFSLAFSEISSLM